MSTDRTANHVSDLHRSDERRYPARPLIGASAAVFRDGRVLLARRARTPLAGVWSLPGGLVEAGERLAAAAAREVFEETGVRAEIAAPADIVEIIRRDEAGAVATHYIIVCFAARWISGAGVVSDEASEIAWLSPPELGGLTITDGTLEVIAKAAALIGADWDWDD